MGRLFPKGGNRTSRKLPVRMNEMESPKASIEKLGVDNDPRAALYRAIGLARLATKSPIRAPKSKDRQQSCNEVSLSSLSLFSLSLFFFFFFSSDRQSPDRYRVWMHCLRIQEG